MRLSTEAKKPGLAIDFWVPGHVSNGLDFWAWFSRGAYTLGRRLYSTGRSPITRQRHRRRSCLLHRVTWLHGKIMITSLPLVVNQVVGSRGEKQSPLVSWVLASSGHCPRAAHACDSGGHGMAAWDRSSRGAVAYHGGVGGRSVPAASDLLTDLTSSWFRWDSTDPPLPPPGTAPTPRTTSLTQGSCPV